jgi:hypothetical protein
MSRNRPLRSFLRLAAAAAFAFGLGAGAVAVVVGAMLLFAGTILVPR